MSRQETTPPAEQDVRGKNAKARRRGLASALLLLTVALWAATRPLTPFLLAILIVVLILALYGNLVAWREFWERDGAKSAALLKEGSDQPEGPNTGGAA